MEGIGPGGELPGRWVRTRTEEDAKALQAEQRMRDEERAARGARRRRSARGTAAATLGRRAAWTLLAVLAVVGLWLTLANG